MSSESAAETSVTDAATRKLPHMPLANPPSVHAAVKVWRLIVVGSEKPVTLSVFLWNARKTIESSG